jgi:hypothetical protein
MVSFGPFKALSPKIINTIDSNAGGRKIPPSIKTDHRRIQFPEKSSVGVN